MGRVTGDDPRVETQVPKSKFQIPMTNDQDLPSRVGMLLVGHGTRDARGVAEFLATARLVTALVPDVAVEAGFLELAEPSIGEALQRLSECDVREVIVVPLLLFAAGHAKQDIPSDVTAAAACFPQLKIRQAEPLGCHPEILSASAERFFEAIGRTTCDVSRDVELVMVSRGTSDEAAIEDVRRFVELRGELVAVREVQTGFMAVAEPSVDEVLHAAQLSACETIVVQPHLLFHGQLFLELQEKVAAARKAAPGKRYLLAGYLGPSPQVAAAAICRFREVVASRNP